jgi:hypothetical protein
MRIDVNKHDNGLTVEFQGLANIISAILGRPLGIPAEQIAAPASSLPTSPTTETAPAPAPAVAPTPEPVADVDPLGGIVAMAGDPPTITFEEAKRALVEYAARKSPTAAAEVLKKYGAVQISALDPAHYPALLADCKGA